MPNTIKMTENEVIDLDQFDIKRVIREPTTHPNGNNVLIIDCKDDFLEYHYIDESEMDEVFEKVLDIIHL